jgi:hypothetical protein
MSSLHKKGSVDFRQGSPNWLKGSDLRDCLIHRDLLMTELRFLRGGIIDFKKQNHISPTMRAERAKLKSCRDDAITAQGKRGTSAALGNGRKMICSFFPSGLARARRAKPEGKKVAEWGGVLPRPAAAAAWPWAIFLPPLRGSGQPNQTRQPTPVGRPVCIPTSIARRGSA